MLRVHTYDDLGISIGPVDIPSRPTGVGLPARCTLVAPPEIPAERAAVWNGSAWMLVEDHRGRQGYVAGTPHTVTAMGPLPEGWSDTAPEPEPPSLDEVRAAKLAEINAGYETVITYIQAGYPLEEVLTWERQATQARALAEDPTAPALFVRSLAATKGLPVEEMCRRILVNAESWEPVAAMLTAQRQLLEEAAFAAQTVEGVQAVVVGYSV